MNIHDRIEEEYRGPGYPIIGVVIIAVCIMAFLCGVLTEAVYKVLYSLIIGWLGV